MVKTLLLYDGGLSVLICYFYSEAVSFNDFFCKTSCCEALALNAAVMF